MTPDEDALLFSYVISLTLRAELEDNQDARFDRARFTIEVVLAVYSNCSFTRLYSLERAIQAHCGLHVRSARAVVRLDNRCYRSHPSIVPLLPHKNDTIARLNPAILLGHLRWIGRLARGFSLVNRFSRKPLS